MTKLYKGFKDAISTNDFVYFNQLLENPLMARMADLENNYALKEVTKKGILSSVTALLKINSVWLSFNEDEVMHIANHYSNHPGIQRLIVNTAFSRFQYFLTNASMGDLPFVIQMFEQSKFLADNADRNNNILLKIAIQRGSYSLVTALLKNNAVSLHCGLDELFLALKHSNHPGIVRALLKNSAVATLVGHEKEIIEKALIEGDFATISNQLQCLKGVNDRKAMSMEPPEQEQVSPLMKNTLFTPASLRSSPCLTSDFDEEDAFGLAQLF